jgi:predicted Zn-dependent protease
MKPQTVCVARPRLYRVGLSLLLCLSLSCAINPVTGKRQVILMSEEDEQRIDEREARSIAEYIGLVEDEELGAYVEKIGQELASRAPRRELDYHFNVVEMDAPNAFALPGGHVYISRGLLIISNSEIELANVLGHEIGHVAARHAAQRDAAAKAAGIATVLGSVGAVLSGADGRTIQGVQVLGAGMVSAYGRNQEREADSLGQDLAAAAGIDPVGMADFLRTLGKTIRLEQGFARETGYFDTHPSTPERVAETDTRSQTLNWKPKFSIAPTRAEYLALLDGLSIGKPAKEGVVRNGRFLHPDLRISISFPHGWPLDNQRSRVIAFSPDRDGVAMLEMQGEGMDPQMAAKLYSRQEGVHLNDGKRVRIGALDAFRASAEIGNQAGNFDMELTWIAYAGNIYRLSAGSNQGAFRRHAGVFRGFARSFRALRQDEEALIDDLRLRICEVQPGEGLAELSRRTGNEWDLNRTAVYNGITQGDELPAGMLLKIGVREGYDFGPRPGAQESADSDRVPSEVHPPPGSENSINGNS